MGRRMRLHDGWQILDRVALRTTASQSTRVLQLWLDCWLSANILNQSDIYVDILLCMELGATKSPSHFHILRPALNDAHTQKTRSP